MTETNAGKEKGPKDGRCEAKAPVRFKVEQIETKVQFDGTGGNKRPRDGKKEWAKRTKRDLKGPERSANPDEGTIAEVW